MHLDLKRVKTDSLVYFGHNTPTQIKAPAKKSVVEADDMYYG
ncbi:hypothetical protein [Dactylosporangium sp. NPDC050588]